MLELKKITKNYPAGNGVVRALRGIDLKFRTSEFVSILGPSGCGKTTMLNIIGGLDQYTDGDLFINGTSTKYFKDRDWDSYRNHSIGFVFQSYNLIPHQTVLQNVELALTLSGVSKAERRKRAKKALVDVGLDGEFNKRPGEMSGGQMQRVAIARALVNNPDIILADEPTGALDTETSLQVMDILKEISKNKLVIMVTHNPELAEKYSTRIIRMLDGEITADSMPLTEDEIKNETESDVTKKEEAKKVKKPSMSIFTSFGLSLKNLFTKKGRTILTSFAGSIGIIGIALIYAVSQGLTTYINVLQEDTLSSYPITLESQHMDISSILESFMGVAEEGTQHENDAVYQKAALYKIINAINNIDASENDLKAFKNFLENKLNGTDEESESLKEALSGVKYSYNLDMLIYTKNVDGEIIRSDATQLFTELMAEFMGMNMMQQTPTAGSNSGGGSNIMSMMSMGQTSSGMWQEMLAGDGDDPVNDLLRKQYDIIGNWPTKYNEIVLVVDENNELDDLTLYALGLKSEESVREILLPAKNGEQINTDT
ncbi:MAG: ABC transporter ATP-binding protein, partial [Clostridia bacterium]|nr:ABC transporter ATP-binding protein [Clostridia bacterium]